jgi:hypothetical protein
LGFAFVIMIFLGGNPGGAGGLAFFLDFGLLQKADNRQAAQPSPALQQQTL